jgi:choline dehydrogenase
MDAMVDGIERMREVQLTYHPSCTARIGSETDGVVDNELRMPPAVMVGEKAADLIRESH